MSRAFAIAVILPLLSSLAGIAETPPSTGPKIVVAEPTKDFGAEPLNQDVAHEFVLRNDGDAPLHIASAVADCACLKVTFDAEIAPHAAGKVGVVLSTGSKGGSVVAKVVLTTDDPSQPKVTLLVQAIFNPKTVVEPGSLRLVGVQHETQPISQIMVWAVDRGDFEVTRVVSPYPYVKLTFHEATEDELNPKGIGRQWRIRATLEDPPVGAISGMVEIYSNHPTDSPLTVPVSGFERPLVSVTPESAELGAVDPKSYRRSIELHYFGKQALTVTKAEAGMPGMHLQIEPVEPGKRFKLWVTFEPSAAKGPFSGTMRLSTDSAVQPMIEIPYAGTIN